MPEIDPEQFGISASALEQLTQTLHEQLSAQYAAHYEAHYSAHYAAHYDAHYDAHYSAHYEREFQQRMQKLYEDLILARRRMFGRSSEAHPAQGRLFDEADAIAPETTEADDQAVIAPASSESSKTPRTPKARGKRGPLPSDLPRVDIVHDVPESERLCACGTPMVEIGEEVSEQLDIVPMQIRVLRHIRKRYGCPDKSQNPVIAPVPKQVLPRSNASPDLLAMLLTVKYVDGLPLARFSHVLERSGARVTRQTLARWVIGTSQALQPLHNLLRDSLLDSPVLVMDETIVQVLKEPDRDPTAQSYMWVQVAGPPGKKIVLYDYDPSRSGTVPVRLLEGWTGYLMTDGYSGYSAVARTPGVEHLSCWAHARRPFVEAQAVHKGKVGKADQALAMIARLYKIEKDVRQASDADRYLARQRRSLPILNEIRQWVDQNLPLVPPSTKLGAALAYLDKFWGRLVRYTERGDLPIDGNPVENAIRPFVVGRKGWLFSDTPAGAHASAVIFSLVETAKGFGFEPYLWLRHVLRRLPLAQTVEDYEALMPWNLHPQDLITQREI